MPTLTDEGSLKSRFETSPNEADSDGDGYDDGEEVTFYLHDGEWTVFIEQSFANPALTDSDMDGRSDNSELGERCLQPTLLDSDFDGQIDSNDPNPCDPDDLGKRMNENGRAMVVGAVLGETGMKDGVFTSTYRDKPGYAVGWISGSVVPLVEVPADLRDGAQNVGQGDLREAALDGVSLAPLVVDDVPKVTRITSKWIKLNPGKSDDLFEALRNSGLLKRLKIGDNSDVITQVAKHDESKVLTNKYDGETLKKITSAGGGGDKSDDLLDKAADAAKSGKADEVKRLADELDKEILEAVLRRGKVSKATRLLDYGVSNSRLRKFAENGKLVSAVKTLDENKKLIYQQNAEKFTGKLEPSDFDRVVYDSQGKTTMLLDTNKWVSGETYKKVLNKGPGWRHVVARHAHPDAPGSWPTKPSGVVDDLDDVSTFPKDLGPTELKEVIETTVKNGR